MKKEVKKKEESGLGRQMREKISMNKVNWARKMRERERERERERDKSEVGKNCGEKKIS